ncbi:hypothetical protein GGR51DRAFT_229878 [Nemania sp. FL0031]|nr:hypothetical protein GGR51DRAFT_229878 [Nemania sp. FL0031]
MDPLSVAGTIAGLVTLADALFRAAYKYYKAASEASHEIEELVNRLQSLAGILHSLKILADALEQDSTHTTIQMSHILNATKLLREIKERLDKAQSKKSGAKFDTIQQSLKWPFTKTKTKELSEKLSQQQDIISLALHCDSLSNLVKLLSDSKDIKATLSSVQLDIQNLQELTRVKVDTERQRILDFFLKVNPQPNLDTSIKLRHPGTGNWLTDSHKFQEWIETAGSRIWLSGIPGSGKTVLAGAVIQEALKKGKSSPKVGVAFFFCDYKDKKATVLSNILGAMASQLARQSDQAFDVLKKTFESLHPKDWLAKEPDSDVLQDCLEKMFKYFDQIIIVVDGLDECGDNTDEVTLALANIADYSTNATMAVASRDEYNIDIKLRESFTRIQIGARKEDILLYVGFELDRRIRDGRLRIANVTLKDEILTALSDKADGMFRWVTCQLDYICGCLTDADRRTALSELPPTLDATYERILRRINQGHHRVRCIVQKCLQLISIRGVNLTIKDLRSLISIPSTLNATLEQSDIIDEEEISLRCSSFIRKSQDGLYFEFSHFTVQEFLERETLLSDRDLAGYHLSEAVCFATLAQQCLQYLQLGKFCCILDMDRNCQAQHALGIFQDFPFHRFATFEWIYALRYTPQDLDSLELVKSLFHPRKTPAFILWATHFVADQKAQSEDPGLDDLRRAASLVSDPTFRTIHLAAALDLPEICEHLIAVDSKWNTVSAIGTPLEYSLGRTSILIGEPFQASYKLTDIRNTIEPVLYATHRPGQAAVVLGTAGSIIQYPLRRFGEWSLMVCAMFFSLGSLDFSSVSTLICMGWVVSDEEAAIFEESMACVVQSYPDDYYDGPHASRERVTASLFDLINALNGFRIVNTDPGYRVCATAWNTAVNLGCAFVEDITVMDTRITLSLKALISKCKVALLNDDVESMQRYLEDERITNLETDDDNDGAETSEFSLLDQAIVNDSAKMLKLLVEHGYILNKPFSTGRLPIHSAWGCGEDTLRLLLQSGASHLSRDAKGRNIWHLAAYYYEHNTLSSLLKLTGDDKISALRAQDEDGYTPLTLAIKESADAHEDDAEDATATVNSLLAACGSDPLCWLCVGSPWELAARYGSATAVNCLAGSGVPLDPINDGQSTPLHVISNKASKECVESLGRLFPAALDIRYEGQIPAECFIYQSVLQDILPRGELIKCLIHDDISANMIQKSASLWKYLCTGIISSQSLGGGDVKKKHESILDVIQTLFGMKAIEAYEEINGHSASLPLFSALANSRILSDLRHSQLEELISRTSFWTSARLARECVEYVGHLLMKIGRGETGWEKTIHILLRKGVDVHLRIGSSSILETACRVFECGQIENTNTEPVTAIHAVQRHVFGEIIDRVRPEQLNATHSSANECLEALINKGDHSGSSWMLERLVMSGLDPNKPRIGPDMNTTLVRCLFRHATLAAMALLKLGADPTATGSGGFNALHGAAFCGGLEFLRCLLIKLGESSMISLSQKPAIMRLMVERTERPFPAMNALHLASANGRISCLQFFIDNGLISNAKSTTDSGYNCLHFAALYGHVEAIKSLCSLGLDINKPADDGSLPIHLAVRNGHYSAVKALVQCGSATGQDSFGMTPQIYATKLGYDQIREFLEESNTSSQCHSVVSKDQGQDSISKSSVRALELAIQREDLGTLERLYSQGLSLDTPMPECGGCSPLIAAIRTSKETVVRWLLSKRCSVFQSACKRHGEKSGTTHGLAFAIQDKTLASYLPEILDIGLESAWNWWDFDSPLHISVSTRNHESLNLVIEHIKKDLEIYRYASAQH